MRALLFDGLTSRPRPVSIEFALLEGRLALSIRGDQCVSAVAVSQLIIGERVGDTNRHLGLPDGSSLEVLENHAFDRSLRERRLRTAEEPIGFLERHWRYALIAGIAAALFSAWLLRFGLPSLAAHAVRLIPVAVDARIEQDTLRVLDASVLTPSKLTDEQRQRLTGVFAEVAAGAQPAAHPFTLLFRTGGRVGANALALPSGSVILTDELVALSKDDDELRGVFAHEVGHLVGRHSMRMLMQSSASALLLVGLFGDASAAASLTAAAPTVLVSSAYSRDFEREADRFSFGWLSSHGISPRHLADLLKRLPRSGEGGYSGYLATHPDLQERVEAAERSSLGKK